MQSFSTTQWAITVLVFVAGWLLGLASHPGGRKWRERYAAEREAHAAARKDADARIAAADTRFTDADTRHRELERENARLTQPVSASPAVVMTPVRQPIDGTTARPTYVRGEQRGWFDWGDRVLP